ncbi:MAG: GNAT family N-acetyltransferase [Ottowia sp.]|nr:GNAT family N-acetyltransferase [Ottowia sp.]
MPFKFLTLDTVYDRFCFNSGSEALDRYFKQQVTQDIRRRITTCFVALTSENQIAGYYTLAATSIFLSNLPDNIKKKLPRYPSVPAVRMGRLAVDQNFKGKGLGGALLADALYRSAQAEIATYALVVDAKDSAAISFYQHYGFTAFIDSPMSLFLPLATVHGVVDR